MNWKSRKIPVVNKILANFFIRRLPELRRERELTRKELAKGVGVTLGNTISGKRERFCLSLRI